MLSVEEIAARLGDKFALLAYRRPVADPRHQALKATIDWSYRLLPAAEQRAFRELSVFAGDFGLEQAAAVCCDGGLAAALDLVDQLAGKSLMVAETTAGRTRYRLLDTIRQYAAGLLAGAGGTSRARQLHAEAFLALAERERDRGLLAREHDNFRAALDWSLSQDGQSGPRLARALGAFWLASGFLQEGQLWLQRALAANPADPQLRADLHRSLGAVLFQAAEADRAEASLAEGFRIAEDAALPAAQARISVLRSEVRAMFDGARPEALSECRAAAAVLEAHGDLDGLAEAWLAIGVHQLDLDVGPQEALERAMRYAAESGNHRVTMDAQAWLLAIYRELPVPVDVAITRAEQLLEQAGTGDQWAQAQILQELSPLYAYAGRFAHARAAIARAQSLFGGLETRLTVTALYIGDIEMAAGNPAAAEPELRKGCQELQAQGHRAMLSAALSQLAEAVYAQGRIDEAHQLTQQAEAISGASDRDAQTRWRAVRAKVLARRGQFAAARQLAGEAAAIARQSFSPRLYAEALKAQAEVARLSGAPDEAASSLREALHMYQERRASALADQVRAALASLSADQ